MVQMKVANVSPEHSGSSLSTVSESGPAIVFQPKALKEVVDIIDLMGNVSTRVREDASRDLGGGNGGGSSGSQGIGGTKAGKTARDEAIAQAPSVIIMQKKLIENVQIEMKTIKKQIQLLSSARGRGSAFHLSQLMSKLRRMSLIVSNLLRASADVIKRYYVSVFIDHQPIIGSEQKSD